MKTSYLGENLIFIISQPRSGSTLLQRVLAGHPDIQTSAETWLMLQPIYGLRPEKVNAEYGSKWAASAIDEYLRNYTDPNVHTYDDAIRAWAQVMYNASLEYNGKQIFLDKTPRYFFIIPDLYRLFPKAKFIFLMRNPLAVLASELTTYVKDDWTVIGDFKPDLVDAPQLILDGIKTVGDDAIVVNYENFVTSPEEQLRTICGALDLDFHKSMLSYADTPAPVGKMNDPVGIHQHSKPSAVSLEKWKKLLDNPQHLHFAQSYLKDLGADVVNAMGYQYDELFATLNQRPIDTRNLFPWRLAIKAKDKVKFKERVYMDHYFTKAKHGPFKGTLSYLHEVYSILWKKIRNNVAR